MIGLHCLYMRSIHVCLEKLELLFTNNKLTFKYVMKLVTDLGVSSSPKQILCFPNAMAHEGNLKEVSFLFPFFLIIIYSRLCVDSVLCGPKLEVSNALVNVESRHVH